MMIKEFLAKLNFFHDATKPVPLADAIPRAINELKCRQTRKDQHELEGLKTGFPCYDDYLKGMANGLHLLLGEPETCKTALAIQIALNVSKNEDIPVIYVAWSDRLNDIARRIIATKNDISIDSIGKAGIVQDEDISSIRLIQGNSGININAIKKHLDKLPRKTNSPASWLLIIDYLQIMAWVAEENRYSFNNASWVSLAKFAFDLRLLAWEKNGVVLAVSNVPRAAYKEQWTDKNSTYYAKGSGDLEYLADSIMSIGTGWSKDDIEYVVYDLSTVKPYSQQLFRIYMNKKSRSVVYNEDQPIRRPDRHPDTFRDRLFDDPQIAKAAISQGILPESDLILLPKKGNRGGKVHCSLELKVLPSRINGSKIKVSDIITAISSSSHEAIPMLNALQEILVSSDELPSLPICEPDKQRAKEYWYPRGLRIYCKDVVPVYNNFIAEVQEKYPDRDVSEIVSRLIVAALLRDDSSEEAK